MDDSLTVEQVEKVEAMVVGGIDRKVAISIVRRTVSGVGLERAGDKAAALEKKPRRTAKAAASGGLMSVKDMAAALEKKPKKTVKRQPKTLDGEVTAKLTERTKAADTAIDKKLAETPAKLFVPGFDIGAFPHHLNRSSLIAPIAPGRRKRHQQTAMVTRKDCVLEYTGAQLDEADGDLMMALIAFAQQHPLGTAVPLNQKEILRKIKSGKIGSSQYEWLHNSMKRLRESTMFLEVRKADGTAKYKVGGGMVSFNMVKDVSYDADSETYTFVVDPRWCVLYGNREYGLLDWDKRMQIGRGLNMAKTLQRHISASSDSPQRYALDDLKTLMQYTGRMRDFVDALEKAVKELVRLEIIAKWDIGKSTKGREQLSMWLAVA